jgi:hypothetical protein
MSIGVGIAIAAVWLFAAASVFSKYVGWEGMLVCIFIAVSVTWWLK